MRSRLRLTSTTDEVEVETVKFEAKDQIEAKFMVN